MWAVHPRQRILDAAERQFADNGFHGASLRAVTREAEVNVAAVHYYFGSKETLLRSTLERIVQPTNLERLRLLDEAFAAADPPRLEAIMDAFVRPDLELIAGLGDRGAIIARFTGRSYTEPEEVVSRTVTDLFGEVGGRFLDALQLALPDVPREELLWRQRCVVAIITYLLTTTGTSRGLLDVGDVDATARRLVAFITPAMASPAVTSMLPAGETA